MSQANSLVLNVMQSAFKEQIKTGYNYHLMPEITYGINKNLMVRGSAFIVQELMPYMLKALV
jgi:hypothetical protein